MGCCDLHNVIQTTASLSSYEQLFLHINDVNPSVIARHILLFAIVSEPAFDPNNNKDLHYLWDVWYNAEWSEETRSRFVQDVEQLLAAKLQYNITLFPERKCEDWKIVWNLWCISAKIFSPNILSDIQDQRLEIFRRVHI